MVNGCEAVAAEAAGKLVDRLISWPVGKGGKHAVQRCKSERNSCAKVGYESIEYGVLSIGSVRAQRGHHRETG